MIVWLDDIRNPFNDIWNKYIVEKNENICWCKCYFDFMFTIYSYFDSITHIYFDHDIASFDHEGNEYTGYDAAKLLIDYCVEHKKKLPKYSCHSSNLPGKENILNILNNFEKYT